MSALTLLGRVQEGGVDLKKFGHSPESMFAHCKREVRFIIFMTLTLVVVLMLQNAASKIVCIVMTYTFPDSQMKRAITELVSATFLSMIVILVGTF
jgi:hypothetical protein